MDHPHPTPSSQAWARWFVILAAMFGLVFVFATPALAGTDEVAHVSRVALIANGHVIPPTGEAPPIDYRADACTTAYLGGFSLSRYAGVHIGWRQQFGNPDCGPSLVTVASLARTADVYSPVPYTPALVGFWAGRVVHGPSGGIYGARLFQLAAYIVLVAYAIRMIPWGKPLLFTIGLLPVSLQGAANVSADPMTLALCLLIVAIVLAAVASTRTPSIDVHEPTKGSSPPHGDATLGPATARPVEPGSVQPANWWILGGACVALALSKSAYVPFVLLAGAIPTAVFGTLRRRVIVVASMIGTAALAAGAWNLGVVSRIDIVGVNHSNSSVAARWIRHHPIEFLESIVRGWRRRSERITLLRGLITPAKRFAGDFPLSPWLGVSWLALVRALDPIPGFLASTGQRLRRGSHDFGPSAWCVGAARFRRGDRLTSAVIALAVGGATVLLIEYGLAIAANPPGARSIIWVQGRYFLPLIPLTLFGVSGLARPLTGRRAWPLVATSAIVLVCWLVWVAHNQWHWI